MLLCSGCGQENPDFARYCLACAAPLLAQTQAAGDERKVVTVLFCDLVGFTARSEHADPEDVRTVLRRYHSRVKQDIEAFDGTVEKFIGDAVMAVFGAPVVHEDDAERAVRAGLQILASIDYLNDAHPGMELSVRIGVNTGGTLVSLWAKPEMGEGMVAGDVVNTAARLQAAAPVNAVVVGERTHRATRSAFEYQVLAPVTAKGKSEPLRLWRAISQRQNRELGTGHRTQFVGRVLELNQLIDLFDRSVTESSLHLVSIVGEPGAGKTRLVQELAGLLAHRRQQVIWRRGRCLPYGEGITFWALGELVKMQAGILESDSPEEARRKLVHAVQRATRDTSEQDWLLARLSPLVGAESIQLGSVDRRESFTAWRRFLEGVAALGPLVVLIEDLHWADGSLIEFIQELVEKSRGAPLLVICTARPELFDKHPEWGGDNGNSTIILLPPLSREEIAALVAGLGKQSDLSDETRTTLLQQAEGNPLYAEELARMFTERNESKGQHEGATPSLGAELPLPETLEAVIAARLDTLSVQHKGLLQNASIVGRVFWSGALETVGGLDEPVVLEGLHELTGRELVRPASTSSVSKQAEYSFWHALVRDVAYKQIPRASRAAKHVAVAEWIEAVVGERLPNLAEILAHHYHEALELFSASGHPGSVGDLREKARYFHTPGRRPGHAARYFQGGRPLPPSPRPGFSRAPRQTRLVIEIRPGGGADATGRCSP
jgi:class 3 adenylate cyclase/energy-coupling factor transporter ATP-binding protein EcfA2